MLAALLWITLIAATMLLIAVASPIRLSCKAAYRESGRGAELRAAASYPHPLALRAEYSAAEGGFSFFVFGINTKRFMKKSAGGVNADAVDVIDDTDSVNTDGINTDGINTDGINTDGLNTDTDGINTDGINTDSANTGNVNAKEKKRSLASRIKSKIDGIKRGRAYKIISDGPLRKKLLRWLKRSSVRALRAVSFEKLKLRARVGMSDPAALGRAYGYFSAARSALLTQRAGRVDLRMEPSFTEKRLDVDLELRIKTTPSAILWSLTAAAATFPYWRTRKAIGGKAEGRK